MRYAREALRVVLSGAGFLFTPLLAATVAWLLYAGTFALTVGLADAPMALWKGALCLKAVWVVAVLHGRRVLRIGCQE